MRPQLFFSISLLCVFSILTTVQADHSLRGRVVDASTGEALPCRLYIHDAHETWHHAKSATNEGRAITYHVSRTPSVEIHTSLSAHPFVAEVPPGEYTITAELGKEYHPAMAKVMIKEGDANVTLALRRWTNMAEKGWFSGDTHVHRAMAELPTVLLAEDLNVALPLTAWVTDSRQNPASANKNPHRVPPAKLIEVDSTHVIWPVNTEYEIFTVNGKNHTLGAVFILNHKEAFTLTAPPVKPIAAEARRQGALLELDKHNWPWSMMLMPTMHVPLFELANNHMWRTEFLYVDWYPEYVGDFMKIKLENNLFTERDWIEFGFQNYYALLNCGFDMKPTAGTASGVHPVPLGFGRVYVNIDGPFSYQKWIEGLAAGQSFVTTGPMLEVIMERSGNAITVSGSFESIAPLGMLEVIVNGDIRKAIAPQPEKTAQGSFRFNFTATLALETTSWVAVRGFEDRLDKRPHFAHTAPEHFEIEGKPLQPKEPEVKYLIKRVEDELKRHQGVLSDTALSEYLEARDFFQALLSK